MKKKMKVYIKEIMGDTETPVTIYAKYVGEERGILLESRESEKGRYSFIGKSPFRTMEKIDGIYKVDGEVIEKGGRKFLEIVEEYMKEYQVEEDNKVYIGGAYGTVGYDIVREAEDFPDNNPDTIGVPDSHLMFFREGIVFDHFYQKLIFTVLETPDKAGEERANKKICEIEASLVRDISEELNFSEKKDSEEEIIGNTTKEEFIESVKKAQKYIYEGDIFQVVLSQRWEMATNERPFNLYRKLRVTNPSPYLFYINFGDYQVAGSSPEMLVEVDEKKIYTCPIAGTRKRGETPKEDKLLAADLLGDEKERSEHVMLVDLARNDVGKVSKIDSVEVTQFMEVQNYSHVMHLVSLVEG
ncbi:MAG: chorismate-binding protein, partial [Psychrilyobacter sp.]|nr:chorismate-binding protein [Psychrilyobacter sp.]